MKSKICSYCSIIIFIVSFINIAHGQEHGKPKIVTTISPIAGIISMLVGDEAEVVSLNNNGGCPHHYHLKPSDMMKINEADIIIYVDEKFDGGIEKLSKKSYAHIIKISNNKQINLIDQLGKVNYHFWLDLNNILPLQQEVANYLIKIRPGIKQALINNQAKALQDINALMNLKDAQLRNLPQLVVMSDSLEHFFSKVNLDIVKAYQSKNASLQNYAKLEQILKKDKDKCIILDSSQNIDLYKKFNKTIVQLDSENWQINDGNISRDLFFNKYVQMINDLKNCR